MHLKIAIGPPSPRLSPSSPGNSSSVSGSSSSSLSSAWAANLRSSSCPFIAFGLAKRSVGRKFQRYNVNGRCPPSTPSLPVPHPPPTQPPTATPHPPAPGHRASCCCVCFRPFFLPLSSSPPCPYFLLDKHTKRAAVTVTTVCCLCCCLMLLLAVSPRLTVGHTHLFVVHKHARACTLLHELLSCGSVLRHPAISDLFPGRHLDWTSGEHSDWGKLY